MNLELLPWIILFLPLLSAVMITLFTLRNRQLSAGLSVGAIVAGFVLSLAFIEFNGWHPEQAEMAVNWLRIGDLSVDFGIRIDSLSLIMLLVVTGVGSLIHIYSVGYMHDDRGFSRYFACMSLFTFSMLGIVLSNNFLQMLIFWELVGVSSYLLIGFWFEKPSAADAAKKAFLTNRVGDFGFILGILTVWAWVGSLNFAEIRADGFVDWKGPHYLLTFAGLLIFCGAVGKSAQFPLHVWLPDAMEGPTPVSALIHAATMVAAGVYMLCRVFFIFTPDALTVIAWIGGITALLAALIAIQQDDIKRILAYSTLSQLGYMVMAVGVHGPGEGMFHLTTHAFFKALLFLGAGSVIHALSNEQDIWKMGGLRKKLPVTFWTFLAGTLALCGLFPFSGFYSKDALLAQTKAQSTPLFILGVLVAVLTTFYMFRLVFVVFFGKEKSAVVDHAHESPPVMAWPLRVLAVLSIIGGFIGIDQILNDQFAHNEVREAGSAFARMFAPFGHAPLAAFSGLGAVIVGFLLALTFYMNTDKDPLPSLLGGFATLCRNKFYFDELYAWLIQATQEFAAKLSEWFDRWIIAGLAVRGVSGATDIFGRVLRLAQTGNLQTYAFLFVLGVAAVLWFMLGK